MRYEYKFKFNIDLDYPWSWCTFWFGIPRRCWQYWNHCILLVPSSSDGIFLVCCVGVLTDTVLPTWFCRWFLYMLLYWGGYPISRAAITVVSDDAEQRLSLAMIAFPSEHFSCLDSESDREPMLALSTFGEITAPEPTIHCSVHTFCSLQVLSFLWIELMFTTRPLLSSRILWRLLLLWLELIMISGMTKVSQCPFDWGSGIDLSSVPFSKTIFETEFKSIIKWVTYGEQLIYISKLFSLRNNKHRHNSTCTILLYSCINHTTVWATLALISLFQCYSEICVCSTFRVCVSSKTVLYFCIYGFIEFWFFNFCFNLSYMYVCTTTTIARII